MMQDEAKNFALFYLFYFISLFLQYNSLENVTGIMVSVRSIKKKLTCADTHPFRLGLSFKTFGQFFFLVFMQRGPTACFLIKISETTVQLDPILGSALIFFQGNCAK